MLQSPESLARIRSFCLGLAGLMCLGYAILALATGNPKPIPSGWMTAVGGTAALVIFTSFLVAGRRTAERAVDELYHLKDLRAHRIAYWSALFLYPVFGFLIGHDVLSLTLAFPVMAMLTVAAYFIPHTILTSWS